MSSINPRRIKAQELLVGVFYKLHNDNQNYFKMYEKYGLNIEKSIFNEAIKETKRTNENVSWDNKAFVNNYCEIFRRVKSNLTITPAAPELIDRLKNKEILPTDIAGMKHSEMAPKLHRERLDEMLDSFKKDHWNPDSKPKQDAKRDGMFQCGKCRGFNIETRQAQTRSADEGMCVFATCIDCGKKWKM